MITVACVLVRGHVPFTADYVTRLRSMVARHLALPHRFVCLTDREIPGVETIPITAPKGCFAWWAKLRLFDPAVGLTGRVLYLDLDTLVVADLAPIVEYPAAFALVPDGAPGFQPKSHRVVHRFNSSVMVWDGDSPQLWQDWTPKNATMLWGDQDWIGERLPDAAAMPAEWFPRLSVARPPWLEAKVVLCKKPKNAAAALQWPWFAEAWG